MTECNNKIVKETEFRAKITNKNTLKIYCFILMFDTNHTGLYFLVYIFLFFLRKTLFHEKSEMMYLCIILT